MKLTLTRCVLVASLLVGVSACGSGSGDASSTTTTVSEDLTAQVASYDLAADVPQRFLVGLLTADNGLVVGGTVHLSFRFLGTNPSTTATTTARPSSLGATADFVPVADGVAAKDGPRLREGTEGVGVYEANDVSFDQAGYWEVKVLATMGAEQRSTTAAFEVAETAALPAAGDPAPRTVNLLPGAPDAPAKAVDSRAAADGAVPDPALHSQTVEQAIATGKPTIVVVSTPVFCVSQFCGPITDTVNKMASDYGARANFVHLEVWRDFEAKQINKAAAEWIYPNPSVDAREPWVFLVDGSGKIVRRWDNVANGAQLRAALDQLA